MSIKTGERKMNFLVLGSGLMGRAIVKDLLRNRATKSVTVADASPKAIRTLRDFLKKDDKRLRTRTVDIRALKKIEPLMKRADTVIGAVSYRFNEAITRLAIQNGCHFCDLGGNNTVVNAQLRYHARARKKGVTIVPDCGLAPGMVSVLVSDGLAKVPTADKVEIRVGGLPVHPKPPMNYQLVFAVDGLINEYVEPCVNLESGKFVTVKPMQDVEALEFPEPFGVLEAFNTSGGTSTLPRSFKNRISNLNYKTIRYPGHAAQFRLLMNLGLTDSQPLTSLKVSPRQVLATCLERSLPDQGPDVVLVRITLRDKSGEVRRTYQIVDYGEPASGVTAMMRMTGYPISIIAQMLSDGRIEKRGVIPQELCVPTNAFIHELDARGIKIEIRD
jgi:lysine 6-dehydrogenase